MDKKVLYSRQTGRGFVLIRIMAVEHNNNNIMLIHV